MECVIQEWRGQEPTLNKRTCVFCTKTKSATHLFGVTAGKKHDGPIFKFFGVCDEHRDKLNALLSGEFDIDTIFLEKYRKGISRNRLNLRA